MDERTKEPNMTPAEIESLLKSADAVGRMAAEATIPTPMGVTDGVRRWVIAEGPCGFAWVNVKPANGRVAKALLAARDDVRKDSYYGGVTLWVGDYGQSMARKEAYATAFANALKAAGVRAVAGSRMD